MQHDGEPRLVERLHDDRAHRLVVGKQVEDGEEEEEAEGQPEGAERCGVERTTDSKNEFRVSRRFVILRWVIGDEPDQNQTEKQPGQVHQSLLFKTT